MSQKLQSSQSVSLNEFPVLKSNPAVTRPQSDGAPLRRGETGDSHREWTDGKSAATVRRFHPQILSAPCWVMKE